MPQWGDEKTYSLFLYTENTNIFGIQATLCIKKIVRDNGYAKIQEEMNDLTVF